MTFIVYESLVGNLTVRDVEIDENLMQLNILINEKEVLECRIANEGENTELRDRLDINGINIQLIKDRLTTLAVILNREFGCNYRILYEGVILGVKNVLMGIQKRRNRDKNALRERLLQREEYIKRVFGENSQQWFDAREAILRFDDVQLRERATKFREFLDVNNEKATKAFCRLSKDGGLCDDINQIRKENGRQFDNNDERGNYIAEFYSTIYKKKLDNII